MLFNSKKDRKIITISGQDISFESQKNQSILDAALKSKIKFPYSCQSGSCGSCKCRLLEGETHEEFSSEGTLDRAEIQSGMILACQNTAVNDIVIEVDFGQKDAMENSFPKINARVIEQIQKTHDITQVTVKAQQKITFIPGQYTELFVEGIKDPRAYSFATARGHSNTDTFQFHIRLVPGGEMSSWFHEKDRSGTSVQLRAPFGSFYLRNTQNPILMIAGGSGMAPIKSILEGYKEQKRAVIYIFGARTQKDLYCLDEINKIKSKWKADFEFMPVLSNEEKDSNWNGKRGLVTDVLKEMDIELNHHEAYLCGPPIMIDKSIELLKHMKMNSKNIFFDRFVDKSHNQ